MDSSEGSPSGVRGSAPVRPEDLARRAREGDARAFEALVERFQGPLYHFLRLRTARTSVAEELTQEAFLRAWRKLRLYDPRRPFATWLFTLARRLAASHARRAPEPAELANELCEELPDPRDPAEGRADDIRAGRHLWALAERVLSADERAALWLRYAEDLPAREIGRVLGKREPTVRVLLFRARQKLAAGRRGVRLDGSPAGRSPCPATRPLGKVEGGTP